MRQFIRHPADIPIEINAGTIAPKVSSQNFSRGGLAFEADCNLEFGNIGQVRIPVVRPVFEAQASVVWCSPRGTAFDIGVEFLDSTEVFRARMVEQVCHIESYKRRVHEAEGRVLTAEEAALEWIDKYAEGFPSIDRQDVD